MPFLSKQSCWLLGLLLLSSLALSSHSGVPRVKLSLLLGRRPTSSVKPSRPALHPPEGREHSLPSLLPHCFLEVSLVAKRPGRSQPIGSYEAPRTLHRFLGASSRASAVVVCVAGSLDNPEGTIGGAVLARPPPKPMQSLAEATCLRSPSCKARIPPPNLAAATLPTILDRAH